MTRSVNISTGSLEAGNRSVRYRSGTNSPRVNGQIRYRENEFSFFKGDEQRHVAYVQVSGIRSDDIYVKATYAESFSWKFSLARSFEQVLPDFDMRAKLRNKIREGDFNAAVALGERKSTLELITGTATKLTKAARMVRKGKFKRACRILDCKYKDPADLKGAVTPANYWLQLHYGWTPLLSDMTNAMIATDLAQQRAEKRQKRVSVFFRHAKERTETSNTSIPLPWGGGRKFFYVTGVKAKMTYRTKIQLSAVVTCDNPTLATVDSLGLLNPAAVAWELVPFSFVVDWFLPIGDWISATPPLWGYSIGQVYETVFQEKTGSAGGGSNSGSFSSTYLTQDGSKKDYGCKYFAQCGGGSASTVLVSRKPSNINSVNVPSFNFSPSISKAVTSLSLLTQQLSNLIRKR